MQVLTMRLTCTEGDHIKVTASRYPFPTVCKDDQATDWFNSLSGCLHWNRRERQKSFAIVESNRNGKKSTPGTPGRSSTPIARRPSGGGLSRSMMMSTINSPTSPTGSQSNSNNNNNSSNSLSRRPSSGKSFHASPSSDALHEQVFGMFGDDYTQDGSPTEDDLDSLSPSSLDEELDATSDEETGNNNDSGFKGWADDEILKARYKSTIAKELDRLVINDQ